MIDNIEDIYKDAEDESEEIYKKQEETRKKILLAFSLYLLDMNKGALINTIYDNISFLMKSEQDEILKILNNCIINNGKLNNTLILTTGASVISLMNTYGKTFRDRVINNKSNMVESLLDLINKVDNKTVENIKDNINEIFYENTGQTHKLITTEVSRVINDSSIQIYKQHNISKVKVVATLDKRVCSDCVKYDGNVYNIDEVARMLPRHPNCRCYFVPIKD